MFKTLFLVVHAMDMIKPKSIAKNIAINETVIVNCSPPSKNSIFERPILLLGEITYHPHL